MIYLDLKIANRIEEKLNKLNEVFLKLLFSKMIVKNIIVF